MMVKVMKNLKVSFQHNELHIRQLLHIFFSGVMGLQDDIFYCVFLFMCTVGISSSVAHHFHKNILFK